MSLDSHRYAFLPGYGSMWECHYCKSRKDAWGLFHSDLCGFCSKYDPEREDCRHTDLDLSEECKSKWRLNGELDWEDPTKLYLGGTASAWKKDDMVAFLLLEYRHKTSTTLGKAFYEKLKNGAKALSVAELRTEVELWNNSYKVRLRILPFFLNQIVYPCVGAKASSSSFRSYSCPKR